MNRVGLRMRRGVRGAVKRNRAKRVVRAAYQATKTSLRQGHDLVIVIQQTDSRRSEDAMDELQELCRKLKLL